MLPLRDVVDVPPVPAELLDLARTVERYYLTSFADALSLVCPPTGALRSCASTSSRTAGGRPAEAGEGAAPRAGRASAAGAAASRRPPALPAQGLAARHLPRARGRRHAGRPRARARRRTPARLGARQRTALDFVEEAGRSTSASSRRQRAVRAGPQAAARDGRRRRRSGRRTRRRGDGAAATAPRRRPRRRRAAVAQAARLQACATLSDIPDLLAEQRRALHTSCARRSPATRSSLHGVTGSGKTEVYLRAAEAALEAGRSVLLLVPEIGLTGQTVARVARALPGMRVAVLHSGLRPASGCSPTRPSPRGEVRIVVGARSAVFAPLRRPRADRRRRGARHLLQAGQRAALRRAHRGPLARRGQRRRRRARLGDAERRELRARAAARRPQQRVDGSRRRRSRSSTCATTTACSRRSWPRRSPRRVDAGDKAILFLNRRGYASLLVCGHCGHTWECPHCDVTLALFGGRTPALPHLRARQPRRRRARRAARRPVRHGDGTEAVEREVAAAAARRRSPAPRLRRGVVLPRLRAGARPLRRSPGAKVLVGTQMIAKGHHFPDVTLVGVVNADLTLHFPDFRAEERTFAMLVQVGGRSGRGDRARAGCSSRRSIPEARPIALAAAGEEEQFYARSSSAGASSATRPPPPSSPSTSRHAQGQGRRGGAVHRRPADRAARTTASRCSARARCGASAAVTSAAWS